MRESWNNRSRQLSLFRPGFKNQAQVSSRSGARSPGNHVCESGLRRGRDPARVRVLNEPSGLVPYCVRGHQRTSNSYLRHKQSLKVISPRQDGVGTFRQTAPPATVYCAAILRSARHSRSPSPGPIFPSIVHSECPEIDSPFNGVQ